MKTTKHTPGPWKAEKVTRELNAPNGVGWFKSPPFWQVTGERTEIGGTLICQTCYYVSENEANARLIAAAPELLQVLEAIAPKIGNLLGRLRFSTSKDAEILPAIASAIAKATGQ